MKCKSQKIADRIKSLCKLNFKKYFHKNYIFTAYNTIKRIYYFCYLLVFPTKQVNLITSHLKIQKKTVIFLPRPHRPWGFDAQKNAKGTFD
jgi:hypothetical protein